MNMNFPTKHANFPGVILVTVATNLVPLYGATRWGWATKDTILLYWLETVIIGFVYVIRIWTKVNPEVPWPRTWLGRVSLTLANTIARTFMSMPFVVHFGGFCFILGMAVLSIFFFDTENFNHHMYQKVYEAGLADGFYLAALAILASHLYALTTLWFANGKFLRDKATEGILRTYVRIITLMAVIIVPAKMADGQDDALIAIFVLVGVKLIFDLCFLFLDSRKGMHQKEAAA